MMSSIETILAAKEPVEQMKTATESLNNWIEEANKLAEEGKELSKVQEVVRGVKAFDKLSTALTVASVGLDIALFFWGPKAPDMDAIILKAIDALDSKVNGLWEDMDAQLGKLNDHLDDATAKLATQTELEDFVALHQSVKAYVQTKSDGALQDLLEDTFEPSKIFRDFSAIAGAVVSTDASLNPIAASYRYTLGDGATITRLARNLMGLTVLAPMAYSLTAALRHAKDEQYSLRTPADADEKFQPLIDQISGAVSEVVARCLSEAPQNISKHMERNVLPKMAVVGSPGDHTPFASAAEELGGHLAHKWYWMDWLVVVGQADVSPDKNVVARSDTRGQYNAAHLPVKPPPEPVQHCWFNHENQQGRFTVFVSWREKSHPSFTEIGSRLFFVRQHMRGYFEDLGDDMIVYRTVAPAEEASLELAGGESGFFAEAGIGWSPFWSNPARIVAITDSADWLTEKQRAQLVSEKEQNHITPGAQRGIQPGINLILFC